MAAKQFINSLHYAVVTFVRILLTAIYGKGQSVKPVTNALLKEPATTLARKIRQKQVTSVEVLEAFISRIAEVNPLLNCVVDNRFDAARKEAAEADALVASGKYTEEELEREKPFLGVPISTKDCLAVEGLLHTSWNISKEE
ncbi:hypothetical protein HA402_013700 [Bradysia odoriphaga]|nr:hypothetical protein HA402_013700 [Bradysia odoriphaga]